jgi:glutathione synthase/RimK-type ligase-like ATP-grasp enzyme
MKRISVLIPDADVQLYVACCLAVSTQVVVHGLAAHPTRVLRYSRFFANFEECKGEIVAERRIDVVLPIADTATRLLSEHRHQLNWGAKLPPLPNPHTFDIATNKATLAEFLDRSGIPHPGTVVVTAGIPARAALSTLKFPVLAKPPLSANGNGIRRFEDPASLIEFLAERPSNERWVVQTFIEGRDLGVNVLCRDGQIVAATVQHAIKASSTPYRSATGVEFKDDPAAMKVAETLIRELRWSGVANIDMRSDAHQKIPLVLEINGRYWFSLLGSLTAGVNFPLLACEMCVDELRANRKPRMTRYFSGKGAVLLSLVGGGKLRIRPRETNLPYLDPLPTAIRVAQSAAQRARAPLLRVLPRVNGAST